MLQNEISLILLFPFVFVAVLSYSYIKRNKFFCSPCPGNFSCKLGIEFNNAHLNSQLSWLQEIICPMKCPAYRAGSKTILGGKR